MTVSFSLIRKLTGIVCLLIGLAMLPCVLISLIFKEMNMVYIFLILFAVLSGVGFLFFFPIRKTTHNIRTREAFFIVALCWVIASVLASFPFFFSGCMPNFIDAFFEAVSGITTTGANIIEDISVLPKGLVFWRSFVSWIGGVGILLFAISILPALGIGTAHLMNAENIGSSIDKYKMRISENARMVYLIYLTLSFAEFILLMFARMGWFEAMINTFSGISNSGITNTTADVGYFNSLYVAIIIAVFCVIGSTNFSTMQLIPRKRFMEFIKEPEIKIYFAMIIIVFLIVTCVLWAKGVYGGLGETLRGSFLQIISFLTTAGFSATDYNSWPAFCKMLLFFVSFIGGCSASTSGGIKISRMIVVIMLIRRNLYKRLHPNAVVAVRVGERSVSADKVSGIVVFVFVYLIIFVFASILLSLEGHGMEVTMSSVIGALSNTGLNFGPEGFAGGFAIFSQFGKLLLAIIMLLGRIEIFAILIIFTSTFWKGNR